LKRIQPTFLPVARTTANQRSPSIGGSIFAPLMSAIVRPSASFSSDDSGSGISSKVATEDSMRGRILSAWSGREHRIEEVELQVAAMDDGLVENRVVEGERDPERLFAGERELLLLQDLDPGYFSLMLSFACRRKLSSGVGFDVCRWVIRNSPGTFRSPGCVYLTRVGRPQVAHPVFGRPEGELMIRGADARPEILRG